MKILKFGGSSVKDAKRIRNVANIIQSYHERGEKFAVVVSALGGITDTLIDMSEKAATGDMSYKQTMQDVTKRHFTVVRKLFSPDKRADVRKKIMDAMEELGELLHGVSLIKELTPRTLDRIKSFGERNSAFILSQVISQDGLAGAYLNATEVVVTNNNFGSAQVYLEETYANIQARFEGSDNIFIITGFIGSNKNGVTTTLGRGGSDYTASLFGAALNVEEIEIWTDVDGVMTTDPRKVKKAFPIRKMTYEEAMEMSHFGAKVIYPPTIIPALAKKIPIRIKNSYDPDSPGTLISDKPSSDHRYIAKGISAINQIGLLTLQGSGMIGVAGTSARLFGALARKEISIILITQGSSEHSICLAIKPEDADAAREAIESEFDLEIKAGYIEPVRIETDLAIIALIGENMKSRPGISGKLFQALGRNGINVVATAQGSSELNISVVIPKTDVSKALNAIHESFFLSDTQSIHLFIVGVGLIGGTLLKQIQEQSEVLRKNQKIDLKVVALANSRKMKFDEDGIDLLRWKRKLSASNDKMTMRAFIDQMKAMNLSNSIFIDNTASKEIAKYYQEILDSSISISSPNKVATSGTYASYMALKETAEKRNIKFFYEANVGAGLPVLTTLNDLRNSGDQIVKIEGVLSGSLSFIFNSFKGKMKFSKIVKEAQKKGYTEPDPRVDLSGKDVGRKLLILAREAGLSMEAEDIDIQNVLPAYCMEPLGVNQFFEVLPKADEHFAKLKEEAEQNGKALRYIATLEGGKAYIRLQQIDESNPFYHLSGSDNMIVFTTARYKERPLVIKGPGAGAEVTAAGVLAEIIRIANYLS